MSGAWFFLFDPFIGTKKVRGTFKIMPNREAVDETDTSDPTITPRRKAKVSARKKEKRILRNHPAHPVKKGWYIFTAILCAIVAMLSLFVGVVGIFLFIFFGIGTWVNIANYRKFYSKTEIR